MDSVMRSGSDSRGALEVTFPLLIRGLLFAVRILKQYVTCYIFGTTDTILDRKHSSSILLLAVPNVTISTCSGQWPITVQFFTAAPIFSR